MMLGMSPFFAHFGAQLTLEEQFAADAESLRGMRMVTAYLSGDLMLSED